MPAQHRRTAVACLPAVLAGVLASAVLAPANPARSEEITLKAALFVPPSTTYGIPFKRFVETISLEGSVRSVGGRDDVS